MNKNKTQDKIDLELSRTYFSNTVGEKSPGYSGKPAKRNWLKLFFAAFLVGGVLLFLAIYFFGYRQARFSFNIAIKPLAPLRNDTTVPEKTVTKKEVPPTERAFYGQKTIYDFEENDEGWGIPAWALYQEDHIATSLETSDNIANSGNKSLKLYAEFPGGNWTAAIAEIEQYLNLGNYDAISVDIYLPEEAPTGLRGKIILTVGENWKFTEMARSIRLDPGKWTTITAKITDDSTDWKRTKVDEAFKTDVRKIAVRIESNKPAYSGPIYIDNFKVISFED
ncbi:MAG: hypothetical protein ABID83_02320 [Candidatus Omnitrophota bacterium]